ncbi:MAG: diguanylate cyclase [Treponema sp.]|nr:diguanylate cyclase [Treponema sp.]
MKGRQPPFDKAHRLRLSFPRKLILGVTLLSVLGLAVVFVVVNTLVRGIIYESVMGIAQRNKVIQAGEIDNWFGVAGQTVSSMATALRALPSDEGFAAIAEGFFAEYDFIENTFIGFPDGRAINGAGWAAPPDWVSTGRPWYVAARAAGGGMATTNPYLSYATGNVAITMSMWVPELDAAVGAAVSLSPVLDSVARHPILAGGYLLIVGPDGDIIAYPNSPRPGMHTIHDIPNGHLIMDSVASGTLVGYFDDPYLGSSYFIATPLGRVDWTLVAVIPSGVTRVPVTRNLALIMATLALVMVGMHVFMVSFVSRITRSMEESGAAEERLRVVFDKMPLASNIRDRDFNILQCNAEAPKLFDMRDKQEYMDRFFELSPEFQPDGSPSKDKAENLITAAFETGRQQFEWMHRKLDGEPIPCEVTLIRIDLMDGDYLLAFVRDLREYYENQEHARMIGQRLNAMLDSSPLACCITDDDYNVLDCNAAAVKLFELKDKKEFCDKFFALSPKHQPDGTLSQEKLGQVVRQTFETNRVQFEWMHQTLDGKPIPCDVIIERITFGDRSVKVGYLRDLRDFHRYQETERVAQQRLQAMLDSSPLACYIFDGNFDVLEVNQEMIKILELADRQDYIGRFFDFSPKYQPDGRLSMEKMTEKTRTAVTGGRSHFEWMYQTLSGKSIPSEMTVVRVTLGGKDLLIGYVRDLREINAAVSMVKQLEKLAFTDTLTGARNRRYFMETAERELHSCIDAGQDFAVVLFDIDHFKLVNDTHGHDIGDEVLKIIVARTRHTLKHDTLVARYGGEEFVIMLPGVSHANAVKAATQILEKIESTPFLAEGLEIRVTVSLGVASRTAGCAVLQDIIKNADRALYHAKETGRNRVVSYDAMPGTRP